MGLTTVLSNPTRIGARQGGRVGPMGMHRRSERAHPTGRGNGSRGSRRGRAALAAVVPVALVLIMLLSEVPSAVWTSVAANPAVPGADAASTPRVDSVRSTTSAVPPARDVRSLCLLGVDPSCRPGANQSAVPNAPVPLGGGPVSSWTNITPPTGASNPPVRFLPSMTYDPAAHAVILFGGYGEIGVEPFAFDQDTWSFANNHWTELIAGSTCTATTCPSPRAGAMLAYDGPLHGLILFGGYSYSPSITYVPYQDTWLFANDTWTNLTTTAGTAPSARFEASMVWDAYDNDVLLFGGSLGSGTTLGDTWTFDGTWHNLTSSLIEHPYARAGAAIAGSPSGWILMFGGENNGSILLDPNCGESSVAWWFFNDSWRYLGEPACITVQHPDALANATYPPCGRIDAALGWSPKNARFVLYGGYGPTIQTSAVCTGFYDFLNDTWTYANPPGSGFVWNNVTDAGDPSAREELGYASDLTDGYFEVFGGWNGTDGGLNETWRFYEIVHAKLMGPSNIATNGSETFPIPFTVTGFGGSGNLSYTFSIHGTKNSNQISGTNCENLTNGASTPLPYDGVSTLLCDPLPTSYNVYHLVATVVDDDNASDRASANWTFLVSPPEAMAIYSQFKGYFYSGISFPNDFGVLATVAGLPAIDLSVTLAGVPVVFSQIGATPKWWNATINMDTVPVGPQVLRATANFSGNWTLNATYTVNVVETPDWLLSVIEFPEITQTISKKTSGLYNGTYSITEAFSWSLDQALGFNIKLPFVSGNVSLIPAIKVSLTATSSGNLTLSGSLSLTPPSINLGVAKIGISVSLSLKGTFSLGLVSGQITGVKWQSAVASITVAGKFGASVPIYGFDILGVKVGFTLEINVNPSVTLGMLLAPTTPGFDEFIQGIAVKIQQFVGGITLPLSVAVSFGIGIASIAIGGQVSVALNLATNTGLYISAGWINGSIFVSASALWWSDQWNLVSGVIYNWTNPPPALPRTPGDSADTLPAYDNGSGTTWVPHARYYAGAGYDGNVWVPTNSSGPAISDIYPYTTVTAAPGPNGTYLYYTDDDVGLPIDQGLGISAQFLNGSSNTLDAAPAPVDPGYLVFNPRATPLPGGGVYVLWDALPASEEAVASPTDLTSVALHGARFSPANGTWGPVRDWTSGGFAQSYAVDPAPRAPTVVALTSTGFLAGATSAERLLDFNLTTGALRSNSSVTGVGILDSVRAALGTVVAKEVDGNYTLLNAATGASSGIPYTPSIGGRLASASFVQGSGDDAVLLFRGPNGSTVVLFNVSSDRASATYSLGPDASDAQGIAGGATTYVFVQTTGGVVGWNVTGGTFANLTNLSEPGVTGYALAQFGSGILVYLLTASGISATPTVTLRFAEIGAALAPVGAPVRGATGSSGPSSTDYALYLAAGAAGVAVLLGVVAVISRRRPAARPTPPPPPPEGPAP